MTPLPLGAYQLPRSLRVNQCLGQGYHFSSRAVAEYTRQCILGCQMNSKTRIQEAQAQVDGPENRRQSPIVDAARTSDEKPEIAARCKLGLQSFVWGGRGG